MGRVRRPGNGAVVTAVAAALGLGIAVGAIFGVFRLPVPAPGNLAGIAGVVGLFIGWITITTILGGKR